MPFTRRCRQVERHVVVGAFGRRGQQHPDKYDDLATAHGDFRPRLAIVALGAAVAGTGIAYALSYVDTLRRIVSTAIGHFTLRTLSRSAQHRVIVAFDWGVAFALTAVLLKTPRVSAVDATGGCGTPVWPWRYRAS